MDPFAQKPLAPSIQPDHPLSEGLVFAWCPTEKDIGQQRDERTGQRGAATSVANTGFAPGKYGTAVTVASGGRFLWSANNTALDAPGKFTFSFLVRPDAVGATAYNFARWDSNAGFGLRQDDQFKLLINAGLPASSPSYTVGKWHHVIAVYDGTNAWIWLDGVRGANGATAAPSTAAVGLTIGSLAGATATADFGTAGLLFWRRALSTSEVYALQADPWAPLRPQGSMEMKDLSGQGFVASAAVAAAGGSPGLFPWPNFFSPFAGSI